MVQLMHWFMMGGYAGYVWSAYGLVCGVLLIDLWNVRWQTARIRKKFMKWFNQ